MKPRTRIARPDALLLDVPDAATLLGLGVTTIRKLAAAGELGPTPRVGRRLLLTRAGLEEYVRRLAAGAAGSTNDTTTKSAAGAHYDAGCIAIGAAHAPAQREFTRRS